MGPHPVEHTTVWFTSASKKTHIGHEAEQRCGCFTGLEGQLRPEYKRVSRPRLPWTVGKTQNDGLNDYEAMHDGRTGMLSLRCGFLQRAPSTGSHNPAPNAYTKPVLVLVDEMSASSADILASMVRDNRIAPLFGYRMMVAGRRPDQD